MGMVLMQLQKYTPLQPKVVSDGELVQRALAGDQNAFETLVRKYSTSLFNFIYHFFHEYNQACDILQEVLLQLHLSLSSLQTGRSIKSWLFQVAHNRCLDELRRKRVIHFSELEIMHDGEDELPFVFAIPDTAPLVEEQIEHHEIQRCLQRAIQQLPVRVRAVVLLRYTSQLTFAEIGQVLSMPEATAKTYFHRAKPVLREALNVQMQAVMQ
jgi:RNA polymerase sigma factor (sigma-70 family)